jgi:hypothetical protein
MTRSNPRSSSITPCQFPPVIPLARPYSFYRLSPKQNREGAEGKEGFLSMDCPFFALASLHGLFRPFRQQKTVLGAAPQGLSLGAA